MTLLSPTFGLPVAVFAAWLVFVALAAWDVWRRRDR